MDALIRREDFEIQNENKATSSLGESQSLKIVELESDSLMFKWLRKPDFQRTTAYWTPQKIAGFIHSFLNGDLIPALIFWQSESSGSIFVIDGAHRLSALVAWVHDDYGDRNISIPFFDARIPDEQAKAANETRRLIAQQIGTYAEIKHGANLSDERKRFAAKLAAGGVVLQWVKGDSTRAYRSFHTINTEQTPIGEIERRFIRDRKGPNAIASRALVSAGTGQFSRSSFSDANKSEIKKIAKEIYEDLFVPPLDTPIKTLDLPVAGRSYSADSMGMILDFVEFVNRNRNPGIDPPKPRRKRKLDILAATMTNDEDGSTTIQFLKNVRRASSLIAGTKPESLGLHPAVYFYSATGNYQPSAFLAAVSFVLEIQENNRLNKFTECRKEFEELLLKYKHFINEIVRKYGSGHRSLNALAKLYQHLFDGVANKKSESEIMPALAEDDRLGFLKPIIDDDRGTKKEFTSDRKSAIYLREALDRAVCCKICGARVHLKSISIDHIQRKVDGGLGSEENGQVSHPYCNSGYKEHMNHLQNTIVQN
ncbi:MAG TPA: DUF262 domain-containing protein [Tepidisphaeraceae bacterium]